MPTIVRDYGVKVKELKNHNGNMGMHSVGPCGDLEHQFLVTVRKGFLKRKVARKATSSNIVTQIVDALMGASEQEQVAMMMKVAWSYPQKWLQIFYLISVLTEF